MKAQDNILIKIGAILAIIGGVFWCLTIIGLIIGIPTINLNYHLFNGESSNKSFDNGLGSLWKSKDVKLAGIFALISTIIGGILIFIGEYAFK